MNGNIKLSICCITYNHEKFIRQALDGFIMQKTNFKYEVLIHDDASTDGTRKIIEEYASKYPEIIKPIYQTENKFSKGIYVDQVYNWPRIQGEYVALCEGDDYWTDMYKLQKQVDFLDNHPDFTVCFHPVVVYWKDNFNDSTVFPSTELRFHKTELSFEELLKHNFIQTNSVVYRWQLKGKENKFPKDILPCDYFVHLLNAQNGKIGFLPEVMAVYRKHSAGIWAGCIVTDEWFKKCGIKHIRFYKIMEEYFHISKHKDKQIIANRLYEVLYKSKDEKALKEFNELFPAEYKIAKNFRFRNILSFGKRIIKKTYKIIYVLIVLILFLLIWIKPSDIQSFFCK